MFELTHFLEAEYYIPVYSIYALRLKIRKIFHHSIKSIEYLEVLNF